MPVYAYLAGAWRQAKTVWHWNGASWTKATKAFIYSGSWLQGYQRPALFNVYGVITDVNFDGDSEVDFYASASGDAYGCQIKVYRSGVLQATEDASGSMYIFCAGPYPLVGTNWRADLVDAAGEVVSTVNFTPF